MRWIEEPNKSFPKWPCHVLTTEQSEPLGPAWVEFWKRILPDGCRLVAASRVALHMDIYARTFEADSMGEASAKFQILPWCDFLHRLPNLASVADNPP